MINQFKTDSILYYPTIEFQSETWVKAAITFWDTIYRIVPVSYKPEDSEEIHIAKQNGFIKDIELSADDLKDTAENFMMFCEDLNFIPAGLDASTYEVRLHSDKIDERLKSFFVQFSDHQDKQGFYHLPESIANGYMFYLADTVGKRRNIPKLTDNRDMFAAMTYFDGEGHFDEWTTNTEEPELISTLIIQNLIPKDIRSIGIEKIIDLSQRLSTSKIEFRELISNFNDKFSKIEDKKFAQIELEKFKKDILDNKYTRKEILNSVSNELCTSVLYVGLPTYAASLVGSVYGSSSEMFEISKIANGILFAGIATVADAGRKIREKWTSKKSNYYFEITNVLDSKEPSKIGICDFSYLFNEFIND